MGQSYSRDIPKLVKLVTLGSDNQKEKAAAALWQLAANSADQETIASAGGIPPLVELVGSGSYHQKEKAAGALWYLSFNGANKEEIALAGGIPPLVELLKCGSYDQKENAAGALKSLATIGANKEEIALAGGIRLLVKLVKYGGHLQKEYAAGALRNITVNSDANQEKLVLAGGIPPLVGLMKRGTDAQKENAAGALWNLALQRTEYRELVVESGAVDHLAYLASRGTPPQRELAAGVLGFLASYLPSEIKMEVATQGGIEALMAFIISPGNAKWVHGELVALRGLCTDGNDTLRAIVKKLDGEKTLRSIRESAHERIAAVADQILDWLEGDFAKLAEMCQRMGEAEPLCSHVVERIKTLRGKGVDSVDAARTRLQAVLVMNADKPMMDRIVSARSLSDVLADLHLEVDLLQPETPSELWRSRWELDKSAMMKKLFDADIPTLISSLEDVSAQEEALTLLLHEVKENKNDYTKQQLAFLQELLNRLAGFSSLGIPVDEKWFIPRTDVQFNDESFNRGASGKVYHGKYMNAHAVIKCVEIKSEGDREDFLREVNVWHEASRLPNIVRFYGACHVGEPCFMVCKYVSGGSLSAYLYRQKKRDLDCVWRVLLGVTRGLQLLHRKGIVHADLKGDNILVEGDSAMITDFGMSFFAAETHPEFGNLGAIRWRAPEFIATKKASFEADVYSLGMCIIEAVTGKAPWGIVPDSAVKVHVKRKKLPRHPKAMSKDEWALVRAMCDFEPSRRITLEEVERRIREFANVEEEEEAERSENAQAAS
jgi:tRNA A-37 threonylcarbamoyl transferase component Bud32